MFRGCIYAKQEINDIYKDIDGWLCHTKDFFFVFSSFLLVIEKLTCTHDLLRSFSEEASGFARLNNLQRKKNNEKKILIIWFARRILFFVQSQGAEYKKVLLCDPFYVVTYYIKWVTTSQKYSIKVLNALQIGLSFKFVFLKKNLYNYCRDPNNQIKMLLTIFMNKTINN